MERILVIEDDPAIIAGIKDNLDLEGYEVLCAETGREGLRLAETKEPDLIVLDIMLPDISGFEVCRTLREMGIKAFIVMLTAKKEEVDIVRGLTLGADDYITKPFRLMELLARIKAILRRGIRREETVETLSFGDVVLDFSRFEAKKGGRSLSLTAREFKILKYFAEHRGKVVTRNELLDKVWGYKMFPSTRTVDNHIMRLRKQIETDPAKPTFIVSVRGVGYKFCP
ncbi:MAG: response regulator transcription factor [Planctomycetota bacterium]|jgi:DNA-binding response OmpR family regulator